MTRRKRPEPPPVDPDQLPPDAQARRDRYQQAQEARRQAAEAFVPANRRKAVKDDKGRLITPQDPDPSWLRRDARTR